MCTVSMVGDYFRDKFPERYPGINEWILQPNTGITSSVDIEIVNLKTENTKLRKELDDLKKEMAEFKKLLIAAKLYDDATDQHECEMAEKVELLKKIAELVGVDLKEVFG